jgi:hypothetical protein
MGILNLFKKKTEEPTGLKRLLHNGLITEEQYQQTEQFKTENRPAFEFLDNYKPDCLQRFIWQNTSSAYNHTYFPDSPMVYTERESYREMQKLDSEAKTRISNDHEIVLRSIREAGLISLLTFEKIKTALQTGWIYKPWEIVSIASTFMKTERYLKAVDADQALQVLLESGTIAAKDIALINSDIREGRINHITDILESYGKIVSIPPKLEADTALVKFPELLRQCLQQLPFYKSCAIKSLSFTKRPNPYHRGREYDHTEIALEFNGKEFHFCFNSSQAYFQLAPGLDMTFIGRIVEYFCTQYGNQFRPVFLVNYWMAQKQFANANIQSYIFLVVKKGAYLSDLFENKLSLSNTPYIDEQQKRDFMGRLFSQLDRQRAERINKEEIITTVLHSDIYSVAQIPNFIPDLLHIVWYDSLSESLTYKNIIEEFVRISGGRFRPETITDTYNENQDSNECKLSIRLNNKSYQIKLRKESVDYDFCKLLEQLQNENDLGGKFYLFDEQFIQDGYSFIFLSNEEAAASTDPTIIKVSELSTAKNLWLP